MAVPLKDRPEFRLRAYTAGAIHKLTIDPFAFSDIIRDLIVQDQSESAGAVNPAPALNAVSSTARQPNFTELSPNLEYVQLSGDVHTGNAAAAQKQGIGGLVIVGREYFQNCVVQDTISDFDPDGSADFDTLLFQYVQGPLDDNGVTYFRTVLDDEEPLRTRVFHTKQWPNASAIIETVDELDADQELRFDLTNFQVAAGQVSEAGLRISIAGGQYSVVLRDECYPTAERRALGSLDWEVWRRFDDWGKVKFEGSMTIRIRHLGGRLGVAFATPNRIMQFDVADADLVPGTTPPQYALREVRWRPGKLRLTLFGVSAHFGVAFIEHKERDTIDEHGDLVPGDLITGDFQRTVPRVGLGTPTNGGAYAGGWIVDGSQVTVAVTTAATQVAYHCTLEPTGDGKISPLVAAVVGAWDGAVNTPTNDFLDITPAMLVGHESTAEPGLMAGADWSFDLDPNILDRLDPNWQNYVADDHPIDFAVRWKYDQNFPGLLTDRSDFVGRLKGYIQILEPETSGVNKNKLVIECVDETMRLGANDSKASVIDQRYPPLDFLFAGGGGAPVFGGTLVKEILKRALGQPTADTLNGNGDEVRFVPNGFPPLISINTDALGWMPLSPPFVQNDFQFKPPWWSYAIDWIKKICDIDGGKQELMVFCFAYADGTGVQTTGEVWPVPIYAYLPQLLANRSTWYIADAEYVDGDGNFALFGAQAASEPALRMNRIIVANNTPGTDTAHLPIPALLFADARLDASDPNSADKTFERTDIVQLENYLPAPQVQFLASLLIQDIANRDLRHPRLQFRGVELMQWGDIIAPVMHKDAVTDHGDQSATFMNLNNTWNRVIRLENGYRQDINDRTSFETTAVVFPLSTFERRSLDPDHPAYLPPPAPVGPGPIPPVPLPQT